MKIGLVAEPWWVNLAVLVPVAVYFYCRRSAIRITAKQLVVVGVFATAFGLVEACVVVYLRAATGLLPGYPGTLSDVARLAPQTQLLGELPRSLVSLEVMREAATMVMLVGIWFFSGMGNAWFVWPMLAGGVALAARAATLLGGSHQR